jgi:flagellar protein FliS
MNAFAAANAYQKVGVESAVVGANPHELIAMLFQGALMAIADAKYQMAHRQMSDKGRSISRAISIIGEGLHASLNKDAGGQIAENLGQLYEYMVQRLVTANLANDPLILDEVTRHLGEIAGAWNTIRTHATGMDGSPVSLGHTHASHAA